MIEIKELSTDFLIGSEKVRFINNLSFSIEPGQIYSLIGESGSGKTLIAYSVMNLIKYRGGNICTGKVDYQGKNIIPLSEKEMRKIRGNRISIIFQEPMSSLNPIM